MELKLDPGCVRSFEDRMEALSPWMHSFKFGENIYTGYYKHEGLGELTYVNSRSDPAAISRMRAAYHTRDRLAWTQFVHSLFDRVAPDRRKREQMRLLDVASATGQLSMMAVDAGFGRVFSSEIRPNQCAQQELIAASLADRKYRNAIDLVYDPNSADAETFPDRYSAFEPDVVCSFGLLYHLTNPVQHLINLRSITRRYVLLYTMAHLYPLGKRMWSLTLEDRAWMTKGTSGVSWMPHLLELARVARETGFRSVTPVYPEMFRKHFPDYDRYTRMTDAKLLAQILCDKLFGLKLGSARNFRPEYFRHSGMSPAYFAYVMEK
jgi:methyltransferase family protein